MEKRVIKFRAWDGEEMWYQGQDNTSLVFFGQPDRIPFGVYNHAEGSRLMTGDEKAIFNNTSILMQFTGLTDKNGVDIYEGDIASVPLYGNVIIVWNENICAFQYAYHAIGKGTYMDGRMTNTLYDYKSKEDFEIIGNIYQHPHLLTQQTDNQ